LSTPYHKNQAHTLNFLPYTSSTTSRHPHSPAQKSQETPSHRNFHQTTAMGKRKPHPADRPKKATGEQAEEEQGTVFFYMPQEKPYGAFCQWHTSPFSIPTFSLQWLVDMAPPLLSPAQVKTPESETRSASQMLANYYGSCINFVCAEQSYMFLKALYFSDAQSCEKILATADPKTQKQLG
jgi:hypothetical protein